MLNDLPNVKQCLIRVGEINYDSNNNKNTIFQENW